MNFLALNVFILFSGFAWGACPSNVICAKDYVIENTSNYTGQVSEVFNNGQSTVIFSGETWTRVVKTDTLSKAVRCYKQICMKDRVIYKNATGTVMSVYSNGKVFVKYDKFGWQLARAEWLSKVVKR